MYKIGVDLGGTNIATGVVDRNYQIVGRAGKKTNPVTAKKVIEDIAETIYLSMKSAGITEAEVDEIGLGIPGAIDMERGIVDEACNLSFLDVPVAQLLEKETGKKISILNDADAAVYGEYIAGSGVGTNVFIAVTLGTGIGCGIVMNGHIYSGCNHVGPELGHTCIQMHGERCNCGKSGCWEAYASATALIRQTQSAMGRYRNSKMWDLCQGELEKVNGKTAFDAMKLDDYVAKKVVDQYCEYVAIGVANAINIFQPDVLCIGGGIANQGEVLLEPVRRKLYEHNQAYNQKIQTKIVTAKLGNDAGIIGAAYKGGMTFDY